jgi:hypothetical protein
MAVLSAASSASTFDLLNASSVATLYLRERARFSAAISASILDLLKASPRAMISAA